MTLKITIECDGYNCSRESEIGADQLSYLRSMSEGWRGWTEHPHNWGTHYCNECWPKVKKEVGK